MASGGNNYDQVTDYLDGLMMNFGAFVIRKCRSIDVPGTERPREEARKKALDLGKTLAEDIRTKRDYIEQREMQEEIRDYFKNLVKMHEKDWEHEYEYWNRINWN